MYVRRARHNDKNKLLDYIVLIAILITYIRYIHISSTAICCAQAISVQQNRVTEKKVSLFFWQVIQYLQQHTLDIVCRKTDYNPNLPGVLR